MQGMAPVHDLKWASQDSVYTTTLPLPITAESDPRRGARTRPMLWKPRRGARTKAGLWNAAGKLCRRTPVSRRAALLKPHMPRPPPAESVKRAAAAPGRRRPTPPPRLSYGAPGRRRPTPHPRLSYAARAQQRGPARPAAGSLRCAPCGACIGCVHTLCITAPLLIPRAIGGDGDGRGATDAAGPGPRGVWAQGVCARGQGSAGRMYSHVV
jgi:hypothetical protein